MNVVVFSAIFLLAATSGYANPVQIPSLDINLDINCPYGYSQPAGSEWASCYKVFPEFKSRRDASSVCKVNNGTLASLANAFVNSYLNLLATQIDAHSVWLGVECISGDPQTCMNDDGSTFIYSNFRPGEPRSDSECIYTSATGGDSQQWMSFDCEQEFQYACEIRAGGPAVTTTTTTTSARPTTLTKAANCPQNYKPFQGMCYNVVNVGWEQVTAKNASSICERVPGGILATIPSSEVNSFVASISPAGTSYTVFGLVCTQVKYDGDRSSCYWLDGTQFNYNAFITNYPRAYSGTIYGNGYCDFDNGKWDECWPSEFLRFDSYVCQAPLN